jgi:hypothetical protein
VGENKRWYEKMVKKREREEKQKRNKKEIKNRTNSAQFRKMRGRKKA